MVWALPATMLRPYNRFEDHLNTIFIPCVLETPRTIQIAFSAHSLLGLCKGHAPYKARAEGSEKMARERLARKAREHEKTKADLDLTRFRLECAQANQKKARAEERKALKRAFDAEGRWHRVLVHVGPHEATRLRKLSAKPLARGCFQWA